MMKKDEFERTLQNPLEYWGVKYSDEVRELLGAEVAVIVGYDQINPHHCYDLFMHSLHTVDELDDRSSLLIKTAAFFHDIGKPKVAMEKNGRLVFYGHAKRSSEITEPLLRLMGYEEDYIKTICFLINHHDDFISWVLPEEDYDHDNPYLVEITAENLSKHIESVREQNELPDRLYTFGLWKDLLCLCCADASSQAELVYMNGGLIDTKKHKLKKLNRLLNLLETVKVEEQK